MYDVKNIGPNIRINSKKLINLCSNDYLGIKSPKISRKQNQSSSRLIAGNDESFKIEILWSIVGHPIIFVDRPNSFTRYS